MLIYSCAGDTVGLDSEQQLAQDFAECRDDACQHNYESLLREIVALSPVDSTRPVGSQTQGRMFKSPGWQAAQNYCSRRLENLGYDVELQRFESEEGHNNSLETIYRPFTFLTDGENRSLEDFSGVNVIGRLKGSKEEQGENYDELIISAHYDTMPYCTGADDNASGMAGALEVARVLAALYQRREKPEKSLVIAFWDREEDWLIGSGVYVQRAQLRKERHGVNGLKNVQVINYDMIGYWREEIGTQTIPDAFASVFKREADKVASDSSRANFILYAGACNDFNDPLRQAFLQGFIAAKTTPTPALAVPRPGEYLDQLDLDSGSISTDVVSTPALLPIVVASPPALPLCMQFAPNYLFLTRSDHAAFRWAGWNETIMLTDTAEFRNPHYHCRLRNKGQRVLTDGKSTYVDDGIADIINPFSLSQTTKLLRATVRAATTLLMPAHSTS